MVDHFKRHLTLSIGIICASTIIMVAAFFWLLSRFDAEAASIFQARNLGIKSAKLLEEVARLRQAIPQAEGYERKIYLLLPTEDELIGFSKWIEGVARINRLSVSFTFRGKSPLANPEEPESLSFYLEATGPYENLKNFTKFIEEQSNQYLLRLDSLDFKKVNDVDYVIQTQGRAFIRPTAPSL